MVAHPIMIAEGRKGPVSVGPIKILGHPGASGGRASRPIHFRRVRSGTGGGCGSAPGRGAPGQGWEPGSRAVTSNTSPQTWRECADVFMER